MRNTGIAPTQRRNCGTGMTLVELMIVVAMLAILAAILVPMFGTTSDMARTEAMASNAAQVKSMIIHHAGVRDVALSAQGYPTAIDGAWFKMGHLPEHSWSGSPIAVEVVSPDDRYKDVERKAKDYVDGGA